jgi:hypothetical protein
LIVASISKQLTCRASSFDAVSSGATAAAHKLNTQRSFSGMEIGLLLSSEGHPASCSIMCRHVAFEQCKLLAVLVDTVRHSQHVHCASNSVKALYISIVINDVLQVLHIVCFSSVYIVCICIYLPNSARRCSSALAALVCLFLMITASKDFNAARCCFCTC